MDVSWWAFVGVVMVAYLVPGPDFLVILRSATRGVRPGAAAALGAQAGLCVHVGLAVAGLSVVLARHPELLTAVRVLGGLYLLYLGGRLVLPTLRRDAGPGRVEPAPPASVRSSFVQAFTTNVLNPKAVLFFAAVLPQFVTADGVPVWTQVAVLGAVDVLLGLVAWTVVVLLGLRLAALLRRERVRRAWDRTTGVALGGLGAGLLVVRD
ncbi:LysE family translocator [Aeromicrobium sp. IC_218]|uniref:LysE family translocator n=1 Tax=Aeromicrobium sp. IC_218 TaxID=2545468 RepID=UPI00103E03D4|nr:LysE family translocator [Aeromicrobium sp. IC_218]TCI99656.1 LysE family translocator [Aeromicrobium sp. IC_218]